MEFDGERVLVTGVSEPGGLGWEIATAFTNLGAHVVLSGRRDRPDLSSFPDGKVTYIQADLSDSEAVRALARDAGEISILVNNAAAIEGGPTPAVSDRGLDTMFAVNLRATHQLVAALQPAMAAAGRGVIINVSSIGAKVAAPGRAMYAATKAALESLTKSWAVEFAAEGVRVNAIAPGPLLNLRLQAAGQAAINASGATVPLGRPITTQEVADAVIFLAGEKARYATGSSFALDGGRTAL